MTDDEIKEQLKQVKYPGFSRDIVSFGLVRSASFADGKAHVSLALTTNDPKIPLHLKAEVSTERPRGALPGRPGRRRSTSPSSRSGRPPRAGAASKPAGAGCEKAIPYAIAIGLRQGGVGKSNLRGQPGLQRRRRFWAERDSPGRVVGLMDCDIYGLSVP